MHILVCLSLGVITAATAVIAASLGVTATAVSTMCRTGQLIIMGYFLWTRTSPIIAGGQAQELLNSKG